MRSAFEVLEQVVQSNPTIEYLSLVTYEDGPNWRDIANTDENTDLELLSNGLRQDQGVRTTATFASRDVVATNLRTFAEGLPDNKLIGAVSKVSLVGGKPAHIPMMDFICSPSSEHLKSLVRLIGEFRQGGGVLLESGRSYHYYGLKLLSEKEWYEFLGRCLLMSGYSDDRYIGHQLIDGHCVLRLSSGKIRSRLPIVVAELS